jgi:cystinosin
VNYVWKHYAHKPVLQVYAVSYVKLFITLVKYMPQVITNYRNHSTWGWSIWQILLDFVGGVLSIAQLLIDSYLQGDWSGITGNPVKLALGNASIFFDIIFMTQHYCLYRGNQEKTLLDTESGPLLDGSSRERID